MESSDSILLIVIITSAISLGLFIVILRYTVEAAVRSALSKDLQSLRGLTLLNIIYQNKGLKRKDLINAERLNEMDSELKNLANLMNTNNIERSDFEKQKKEMLERYHSVIQDMNM